MHKIIEKSHRTTRSMSHFKSTKTLLGSSLDQGLNIMQSPYLNVQSKRICKSEECAIDDTTLPRSSCEMSSNETLNETIFNRTQHLANRNSNDCSETRVKDNDNLLESDIEIMVPMSVSKLNYDTDDIENPATCRQKSSNSISSCEMALSSSLADGEDSSNGNSSIRNEENADGVFINPENKKCDNGKNNSAYQSIEAEKSRENPNAEGLKELCVQRPYSENLAESSHSLVETDKSDSENLNLNDNSEKSLQKEYAVKCDTKKRYF